MPIPWIDNNKLEFPPTELASTEPNGLLAVGGDLRLERLLKAYELGIFPWYEEGQPILWWAPDPRMVLQPDRLRVSRSLRKLLRQGRYQLSMDKAFAAIIAACSEARGEKTGTWITEDMQSAYSDLHASGFAHSVEIWSGSELVGGLYGVALGQVFFGESMFSKRDNTSKLALVYLVKQLQQWNYQLIDCQVSSKHLLSLGAVEISRSLFQQKLDQFATTPGTPGPWQFDADVLAGDWF